MKVAIFVPTETQKYCQVMERCRGNTVESTLVRTLHHWTDALNVKILRSTVTECQLLCGSSIVRIDGWFTDW